jgi:DNA-binding GntR family transcriptional regulator
VQTVNKSEQAYDAIETMITFQDLAPGAMISESILMELTGLGRTPVREALQRLARERMVEIHPNRGVFVASTSIEAQLKLLELRRTLEELAVRLAAHRASVEQKDAMIQLADEIENANGRAARDVAPLLKHTHELIVAAASNEFLSVAMTPLQGLSRRFWFGHPQDPKREIQAASQLHSGILRAISSGDETLAAAASLQLNDYLVDFAYQTLQARELPPAQRMTTTGRTAFQQPA